MAKKGKAETLGGMIGVVLVIVALAIMIGIALLPLVLLVGAIYYHVIFVRMKNRLRNHLSDFWLNHEEKCEFQAQSMNRTKYAVEIAAVEKKAKDAGIRINNDGRYSTRSNIGKAVRDIYSSQGELVKEIDQQLAKLRKKPLRHWEEFNEVASKSKAFFGGLIAWLAVVSYYIALAHTSGVLELNAEGVLLYLGSAYREVFLCAVTLGGMAKEITHVFQSFQIIGYSFGGGILGSVIFKCVFCNYGALFSPKPPVVTLGNLDVPVACKSTINELRRSQRRQLVVRAVAGLLPLVCLIVAAICFDPTGTPVKQSPSLKAQAQAPAIEPKPTDRRDSNTWTASEFARAYIASGDNEEDDFEEHRFTIEGHVIRASKSTVVLGTRQDYLAYTKGTLHDLHGRPSVSCVLRSAPDVEKLTPGELVTVEGMCTGRGDRSLGAVRLSDCSIGKAR